ncbi:MAG: hypothetical protein IPQ01_08640 [Zoogloea sp.]|nr:hypothetical protein [Zoogloea sp.]
MWRQLTGPHPEYHHLQSAYPATATLGDRVWLDTNANGVQDAGETGLAGSPCN